MQTLVIICILLTSIESLILFLASHPKTKHFFKILPAVFWIYFLPMLASSMRLLPEASPVYVFAAQYILPASLFLLLMDVDVKAILCLGPKALFLFLAGSLGVMIGTVLTFYLFKPVVGPDFWSGFGSLSASWMGGSANMVAVKEAIQTPDIIFAPMVVVDTIIPYVWMGLLIAFCGQQKLFDRWVKADPRLLEDIHLRMNQLKGAAQIKSLTWQRLAGLFFFSFGISLLVRFLAESLPVVTGIISTFTWVIILVSLAGLGVSMTPVRPVVQGHSTRAGYYCLYFVLTTIGAKANISYWGDSFILLAAGGIIVAVHAVILVAAARLLKAPMVLVASASQANLGGVASAPMIAEIYQPGLSAVGLCMAILGNIVGTYLGIITAQLCRWMI